MNPSIDITDYIVLKMPTILLNKNFNLYENVSCSHATNRIVFILQKSSSFFVWLWEFDAQCWHKYFLFFSSFLVVGKTRLPPTRSSKFSKQDFDTSSLNFPNFDLWTRVLSASFNCPSPKLLENNLLFTTFSRKYS